MSKDLPFELSKNEEVITEVERSKVPYIFIVILSLVVGGFFYSAFFQLNGAGESWFADWFGISRKTGADIAGIFALLAALTIVFGLIGAYVYSLNRMFITNEHIVRIKQYGLVATDKKVISHLNIEDIKARQNIVGRIFGYGLLTMSTEGQNATYEINFIKRPFEYVRVATDIRDDYQQNVIDNGGAAIPLVEKR